MRLLVRRRSGNRRVSDADLIVAAGVVVLVLLALAGAVRNVAMSWVGSKGKWAPVVKAVLASNTPPAKPSPPPPAAPAGPPPPISPPPAATSPPATAAPPPSAATSPAPATQPAPAPDPQKPSAIVERGQLQPSPEEPPKPATALPSPRSDRPKPGVEDFVRDLLSGAGTPSAKQPASPAQQPAKTVPLPPKPAPQRKPETTPPRKPEPLQLARSASTSPRPSFKPPPQPSATARQRALETGIEAPQFKPAPAQIAAAAPPPVISPLPVPPPPPKPATTVRPFAGTHPVVSETAATIESPSADKRLFLRDPVDQEPAAAGHRGRSESRTERASLRSPAAKGKASGTCRLRTGYLAQSSPQFDKYYREEFKAGDAAVMREMIHAGILISAPRDARVTVEESEAGLAWVRIVDGDYAGRAGWARTASLQCPAP
jgi:hypothetical protein